MKRLIVKNFGPLKDIDIELNKINLFIGENGSGKSILAKIITIVLDLNKLGDNVFNYFEEYNISFFTENSIIKLYKGSETQVIIQKNIIILNPKYKNISKLNNQLLIAKDKIKKYIHQEEKDSKEILKFLKILSEVETKQQRIRTQYIPAERSLISLFNKSLTTLLVSEVPLPKFLLQFSSEFEKAGNELKELEFLNIKYINGDGLDRHKVYFNDKDYLPLEFSSSGIQSALPLYLTIKYFSNRHSSIIIEEPEQNLFPKAQAETIKYIIEQISNENRLFLMTHSPYVLSTLNNLIMSYKVAQMSKETKEKVKEFIKKEQWINPNEFSAYYLEDGIAKNIVSKRGLISDNKIDNISDEVGDEFDRLMEIYREFKYAK